ncbi:hypothetical protein PR048_006114 [Dryococelus australis]|uniref:Uncharacterized protein n=1 Tax=Dryococelus australis TaxID=614101 RepID=A0ABQ9IA38_9NEOP|nr:hypothetical protein PR048_006114 [Dryococelus australis]
MKFSVSNRNNRRGPWDQSLPGFARVCQAIVKAEFPPPPLSLFNEDRLLPGLKKTISVDQDGRTGNRNRVLPNARPKVHRCRGGKAVRLPAYRLYEPSSIPGGFAQGFSHVGSAVSPPLYSGAALFPHRFTSIDSQDLDVKSRPNLFHFTPKVRRQRNPSRCVCVHIEKAAMELEAAYYLPAPSIHAATTRSGDRCDSAALSTSGFWLHRCPGPPRARVTTGEKIPECKSRGLLTRGWEAPKNSLARGKRLVEVVVLDCSPPTKANRTQFPPRLFPDCRKVRIVPDDAAGQRCSLGSPFPPPLHSGAAPFWPHFTFINSQDSLPGWWRILYSRWDEQPQWVWMAWMLEAIVCGDIASSYIRGNLPLFPSGLLHHTSFSRPSFTTTAFLPPSGTGFDSRWDHPPDFRKWESCRTMPLVDGFSRGSPVSPTIPPLLHINHALPSSTFKILMLRAAQISSLTYSPKSSYY